jgi:hypothetical protein
MSEDFDFPAIIRAMNDIEQLEKIQAALDKLLKEVADESRYSKD